MEHYSHRDIENKWRKRWNEANIYASKEESGKPKSYVLDMFPYPSGEGLHVGHPKGYIATDVYSRHKRMTGHSVLHPMGWDAFGLPAENYALKNKVHPRVAVERNIARFKEQLEGVGFDYDWSREINTTDPAYYKWTQWIFLKLFEKGLAYESHEPINWCPSCMTGLANEDLESGACERCGSPVEKKRLRQWVLKITQYADRLLNDLELLPKWPEHIKELQRNWIGRSEGAQISFQLISRTDADSTRNDAEKIAKVEVFTTRPDTLFGATYLVLAPEHALVPQLKASIENWDQVVRYIDQASKKSEIERTAEGKEKTGVELKGVKAVNPANQEEIPVWIADYVLGGYGTGAIMAVPAHDVRDFEFAKRFNISIREVIEPVFTAGIEPSLPLVEREAISAVIKHWSEDKYLGLQWKKVNWGTFVTGGIEGGQTPEEAAIAEIRQETGYQNLKLVRTLPRSHSKFYHVPKKENRFAHFHNFYFELQNGERAPVSDDELEKHDIVWLSPEEMPAFLTPEGQRRDWQLLMNGELPYAGSGMLTNSGKFTGMDSDEAKGAIAEFVKGRVSVNYKLRDWVFSRQRYWGEPIPIIHCEKDGAVAVPEKDLPVFLPEVESYEPTGTGESPLANIAEWVNTVCPKCGGAAKRETNTMPQWAGSSWYYLRYMDPHNDDALVSPEREKHWAPVDMYVGGAEHATRHLIYARFWHKFLYDNGIVSTLEPFEELHSVGLVIAEDGRKMSKRFGNVINPDDIVEEHGADTLRVYEMFMGPFENTIAWNTKSLIGARRFLERVARLEEKVTEERVASLDAELHRTIAKVGADIDAFKFNTAISRMMIFVNAAEKAGAIGSSQWMDFLKLLAPFAPHLAEELWSRAGGAFSIHSAAWPEFDPAKVASDTVRVVVQINGKVRANIELPKETGENELIAAAREAVAERLHEVVIARTVVVPGRLVNFVVPSI